MAATLVPRCKYRLRDLLPLVALSCGLFPAGPTLGADVPADERVAAETRRVLPEITEKRHTIHRHPFSVRVTKVWKSNSTD